MNITKSVQVEMPVTVEDVAKLFCAMDERDQSKFFNAIADEAKKWSSPFCFQMQSVSDCPLLNDEARGIMREIGNYSDLTTTK